LTAKRQSRQVRLLSELRALRGVTQQELADRLQLHQSAVSKLERREDPSFSALRYFVGALGGELFVEARFPSGNVEYIGCHDDPPKSR
jgi:transcriptional regulator with XRE-family HTH domain